jgi:hypothetical protein
MTLTTKPPEMGDKGRPCLSPRPNGMDVFLLALTVLYAAQ